MKMITLFAALALGTAMTRLEFGPEMLGQSCGPKVSIRVGV